MRAEGSGGDPPGEAPVPAHPGLHDASELEALASRRTRYVQTLLRSERPTLPAYAVVAALLIAVLTVPFALGPERAEMASDCAAPAGPGVNWSNCDKESLSARRVNLAGANLRSASFRSASLMGARLLWADLSYAELNGADLSYASLREATLVGADLRGADLTNAILSGANLAYADLSSARLGGAELTGARFDSAIWIDATRCRAGSVGECLTED